MVTLLRSPLKVKQKGLTYSREGPEKIVVMSATLIEAYLDESGTHKGSQILVVAGYFGSPSKWNLFLDHWKYKHFHAKAARFDKLKPALVDAINRAELEAVEVCLRTSEFAKLANADFKSSIGNPYAATAFLCAGIICNIVTSVNKDARIALVLEDGQPNVLWVQRLLISMMPDFPIASVTVVDKSDFPQLHPADLLAHSRSTTDTMWMDMLFEKGKVAEKALEGALFEKTSSATTELLKRYRYKKTKEKRLRKRDNSPR